MASYDLTNYGRGIAYIFVNELYGDNEEDFRDRRGAYAEYKYLKRLFQDIGFKLHAYMDKSNDFIMKKLQQASRDPKLEQRSCFVCVICCHGVEKTSETVGGETVTQHYLVDRKENELNTTSMISLFRDCAALRKKPKLFFIQACRENAKLNIRQRYDFGIETLEIVQQTDGRPNNRTQFAKDGGLPSLPQMSDSPSREITDEKLECGVPCDDELCEDVPTDDGLSDDEDVDLAEYFKKRRAETLKLLEEKEKREQQTAAEEHKMGEHTVETDVRARAPGNRVKNTSPVPIKSDQLINVEAIPCYEDMLVMFASTPGHYALRDTTTGGVLISSLCEVLNNYLTGKNGSSLETTDFVSIMIEVIERPTRSTMPIKINSKDETVVTVPVMYHKLTKDLYIPLMKPVTWIEKLKSKLKHLN